MNVKLLAASALLVQDGALLVFYQFLSNVKPTKVSNAAASFIFTYFFPYMSTKVESIWWDSPFKIFRFIIQDVFKLTEATNYSVSELVNSEVRIFLLYSTQVNSKLNFHETVALASGCSVWLPMPESNHQGYRGLAQHGGPPGWLEESDLAGVILYVIDGPYCLPFLYSTGCPDRSCPAASWWNFPAAVI
jgi:hypothetical protein